MKGFLQLALPNPQFPADLVRLPEEIFNGKLHFFLYNERDDDAGGIYRTNSLINLNQQCFVIPVTPKFL